METAEVIVKDILLEALVQGSEAAVESFDFNTTVRYMNRFMAELAVTTPLGYTSVTNPTDNITIPDGAILGLIYNVALRILPSYDITPTQELITNADLGLKAMMKIGRINKATKHPSTLPMGSGNNRRNTCNRYYVGTGNSILTEQNGNIILEDTTNE